MKWRDVLWLLLALAEVVAMFLGTMLLITYAVYEGWALWNAVLATLAFVSTGTAAGIWTLTRRWWH